MAGSMNSKNKNNKIFCTVLQENFDKSLVPWIAPLHQRWLERLRSSRLKGGLKDLQNFKFTNLSYLQIKMLWLLKYLIRSLPALDLWGYAFSVSSFNEPDSPQKYPGRHSFLLLTRQLALQCLYPFSVLDSGAPWFSPPQDASSPSDQLRPSHCRVPHPFKSWTGIDEEDTCQYPSKLILAIMLL